MECLSYCLANKTDINALEKSLSSIDDFSTDLSRYVLILKDVAKDKMICIFKHGTLVSWNVKRHELKKLFNTLLMHSQGKLTSPIFDGFHFEYGNQTKIVPHPYFNTEEITLEDKSDDLKLALSYGFSQSVKLKSYEEKLDNFIGQYMPYIYRLTHDKKFKISRRRIRQIIGEMITVKSELNLLSDFLYQPKFFWQHPNLEEYYLMLERYFDITERVESINEQLNTMNEVFSMFNSYLEDKHSRRLEIVIIVLIMVEIIFSVLNFHL